MDRTQAPAPIGSALGKRRAGTNPDRGGPFGLDGTMKIFRTHTCGQLRVEHVGQSISLNGWVNSYRDHGNLIFIDLRDRFGITQLVFDPEDGSQKHLMEVASKLRSEDVIGVTGKVRIRIGGENPKHATGKVELVVTDLEVLNKTENPPFLPDDYGQLPNEEIRLKYRYLDLRRPSMQKILGLRSRALQAIREYFVGSNGFLEIETPVLYKSTPEELASSWCRAATCRGSSMPCRRARSCSSRS